MKNEKTDNWNKKNPNGKAPLSWTLEDYEAFGEEPAPTLMFGKTEGEAMEEDEIEGWARESIRTMCVIKEEYPKRFEELYQEYLLDLDYLKALGKITQEEQKELEKKENFSFGEE